MKTTGVILGTYYQIARSMLKNIRAATLTHFVQSVRKAKVRTVSALTKQWVNKSFLI